jgi:hypothetical protein
VNGRFSGNPNGRPVESRTVFSQGFLKDLASVWAGRGRAAMEKTAIDQPGAELIEKFAIARNKAAVLCQPFGEPLHPLKRTFAEMTERKIAPRAHDFRPSLQICSPVCSHVRQLGTASI